MLFSLPTFRAATLLALTFLTACSSKKDDATPAAIAIPVGMTWTVDGNNITASNTRQITTGANIEIIGASTTGTGIDIKLPKAVGTYAVPGTGATAIQALYVAVTTGGAGYLGTTGTVTVIALTATNIVGTFTFSATDSFSGTPATKTITNGKFNITL